MSQCTSPTPTDYIDFLFVLFPEMISPAIVFIATTVVFYSHGSKRLIAAPHHSITYLSVAPVTYSSPIVLYYSCTVHEFLYPAYTVETLEILLSRHIPLLAIIEVLSPILNEQMHKYSDPIANR